MKSATEIVRTITSRLGEIAKLNGDVSFGTNIDVWDSFTLNFVFNDEGEDRVIIGFAADTLEGLEKAFSEDRLEKALDNYDLEYAAPKAKK